MGYSPAFGPEPVEAVLKRRGFTIETRGDNRNILLPLERKSPLSGEQVNEFRRLFSKAAFRKLIRRIILGTGKATMGQLASIAPDRADEYVAFLVSLGVAERSESQVTLTRSINNIGPTLEWYVADVCQRDFEGSSEWSVTLPQVRYGGDYDVLAWLPPTFVYIETKSARPSEVSESELKHFLQRGIELSPDLAILLVDTEDGLDDSGLLKRLFEAMSPTVRLASGVKESEWHPEKYFIAPQPGYRGVNFG